MKKKISALLCGLMVFSLVGCGGATSASDSETKGSVNQEAAKENPNEKTVDGVKFTISNISRENVKGDRTQDNVSSENGEYFANGSKTVKASDYEYIVVNIKVENTTDKAISLSQYGWLAQMKDGYKLKNKIVSDNLKEQMPSNYSVDGQVKVLAEKKLAVKQFELKYNLIDYANMGKMVKDSISGKSEADCKIAYPELFKENYATFNIEVK